MLFSLFSITLLKLVFFTFIYSRTKVHAQRKFAQGSPCFPVVSRDRERENGCTTNTAVAASAVYNDPANDVMPDVCPKTEDFLNFLCFRSFPGVLPASLNYFGDPLKHNFVNGVPPSEKNNSSVNLPSKQESNKHGDTKQVTVKQTVAKISTAGKQKTQKKQQQIKNIHKNKVAVGRIHSSFRRSIVNSGIMTRRGLISSCSDLQVSIPLKSQILKNKKKRKPSPLPKRVATRSQLRKSQIESPSGQPSSDDSSDSETSSSEEESPIETKSPANKRRMSPSKSTVPMKKAHSKLQIVKSKTSVPNKTKISNLPVSKNTRQSAARSFIVTPHNSPARKTIKEPLQASPITLRRKSLLPEPKTSPEKEKTTTKTSPEKQKAIASSSTSDTSSKVSAKITRETAKKNQPPSVTSSPTRRPSRRTKEAATLFMTLMGQEDEFNSSELEEQIIKSTKEEGKPPFKKKSRVLNGKKTESRNSASPPAIRTRRTTVPSGTSSSPAKRREVILQEAAKRFTATQSSSSSGDSSSEEENDSSSSSSSSEEETHIRSIRTRSFDPAQATKSPSVAVKTTEEVRKTRATAKVSNQAPVIEVKISKRVEPKKNSKVTTEKADTNTRKRSIPKRTVVTPTLSYDLSSLIEAPVFHPSEKEFTDPIEYLEKIRSECEPFGICRIVPPPSFKPECQVSDAMRFTAHNQYIHRMFRRRGPNSRVLDAIHRHLRESKIKYKPPPCISGVEIDLPGLYQAVEDFGGPGHVLENRDINLWPKIADTLKVKYFCFRFVFIFLFLSF